MPQSLRPDVEGFIFLCKTDERSGQIVEITGREHIDHPVGLPTFRVRFADGSEAVAVSHSLHPWYAGAGWADEDDEDTD